MDKGSAQTPPKRRHTNGQQAQAKVLNVINCQKNANQNTMRQHIIPDRLTIIITSFNVSVNEDVERKELSDIIGGDEN